MIETNQRVSESRQRLDPLPLESYKKCVIV
jgi:hypothetical protein